MKFVKITDDLIVDIEDIAAFTKSADDFGFYIDMAFKACSIKDTSAFFPTKEERDRAFYNLMAAADVWGK